jgi:uncharacterized protein
MRIRSRFCSTKCHPERSVGAQRLFALSRSVVAIAILLLIGATACTAGPSVSIQGSDGTNKATVVLEIADTAAKREVGLMYRNKLDANAGMIFVFPSPGVENFWMKNTEIPLDMLFADPSGKIIGIVANAEPYSQRLLGGFANTLYVLEVNGGFCAQHKVVSGDTMKFSGFSPTTSQ